ncbi:MAG TPA: MFS transporter [Acidimicrobiales bacterium]|jgi:EmrB/QacA subfamily drug resistance transporter
MPSSFSTFVHQHRRWIALVVVCFAMLMNTLDQTIVNVALPTIQRELHFSQASLAWVVDAYLITFAGALLLAGRLGDLIGRKKVFLFGIIVFTVASAACGVADSELMLVGARFVQGLGAALSSSVILAIIVADFPDPGERNRAMSSYILVAVGGGSLGLLLGGEVTQALSWHWIFFLNLPIGAATLAAGWFLIDENVGLGIKNGVDYLGALLSTAGMMLAVYAIVSASQYSWGSPRTLLCLAGAAVLLGAFVLVERRVATPMMPIRVLRAPGLLASSGVRALMVVGMYSTFFIGVLYLQHVLGYDPIRTGLAFLPQTISVAAMSTGLTARIMKHLRPKMTALTGMIILTVGLAGLVASGSHTRYFPELFFAFLLIGMGAAMAFTPLLTIAVKDVPAADAGIGSGVVNVSQQVSAGLAVAIFGSVASDRTASVLAQHHLLIPALDSGYRLTFLIATASVIVAVVLGSFILRSTDDEPGRHDLAEPSQLLMAEVL